MSQSIYNNGGIIGSTLNFNDISIYPDSAMNLTEAQANLNLTKTISPSTSISFSATERGQNAVMSCDVTFPENPTDGRLYVQGAGAIGAWVGLRDGGTVFRVRAGDGVALSESSSLCALLDITDFPKDGQTHTVTWEFQISPGRVRLWIDGFYKGQSFTVGNGPLEANTWAGSFAGQFVLSNNSTTTVSGEPTVAWPGTDQGNGLRYYQNQVYTSLDPAPTNQKNSGIWSLDAVLNSIFIPEKIAYVNSAINTSNLTSYNFFIPGGIPRGLVAVVFHGEQISTTQALTVNSITVGSSSATKAVEAATLDTNVSTSATASIWYVETTTEESTINVSLNSASRRGAIGVYIIGRYQSSIPSFTSSDNSTSSTLSKTISTATLPPGSRVIGAYTGAGTVQHDWTGLVEDYDSLFGTGTTVTGPTGASSLLGQSQSLTITCTGQNINVNQPSALAVAVWN